MVPELREKFNAEFSEDIYQAFIADLNESLQRSLDFRVSETPLFLSPEMTGQLVLAAEEIAAEVAAESFSSCQTGAIPAGMEVPNEDEHSRFLQIDFAISRDERGRFDPQLIELQGFPSLYGFQYFLNETLQRHFPLTADQTPFFSGYDAEGYLALLKKMIIGNCDPETVILLEAFPKKQKTRIDFHCTEELIGLRTACLTDLSFLGNRLVYRHGGREIPVHRIYNRIIFEDARRQGVDLSLCFREDLGAKWVAHPNWYFKLSKYVMPHLKSRFCPPCYYLQDLSEYPSDLDHYVLKPLFSFAGGGVQIHPTRESLDAISDRENYILQRKVTYAPLIKTPDGYSKVEIRMMFLWDEEPILVNNLIRMTKGEMVGVAFNRDKTWVGSSIAYHRQDSGFGHH